MRGDRPSNGAHSQATTKFTPHARGSTYRCPAYSKIPEVYPACAGIDLVGPTHRFVMRRLPRMRGDRPRISRYLVGLNWFTPHARGSTCGPGAQPGRSQVYPACAGIDLEGYIGRWGCLCLPRMRGDRPGWIVLF